MLSRAQASGVAGAWHAPATHLRSPPQSASLAHSTFTLQRLSLQVCPGRQSSSCWDSSTHFSARQIFGLGHWASLSHSGLGTHLLPRHTKPAAQSPSLPHSWHIPSMHTPLWPSVLQLVSFSHLGYAGLQPAAPAKAAARAGRTHGGRRRCRSGTTSHLKFPSAEIWVHGPREFTYSERLRQSKASHNQLQLRDTIPA